MSWGFPGEESERRRNSVQTRTFRPPTGDGRDLRVCTALLDGICGYAPPCCERLDASCGCAASKDPAIRAMLSRTGLRGDLRGGCGRSPSSAYLPGRPPATATILQPATRPRRGPATPILPRSRRRGETSGTRRAPGAQARGAGGGMPAGDADVPFSKRSNKGNASFPSDSGHELRLPTKSRISRIHSHADRKRGLIAITFERPN